MLYIYNTLSKKKEEFIPLEPGKIGIYCCGITVYDLCHLGHARAMVCFDVFVRFLRSVGFEVTFVRNITDIDDKIIARAIERGINIDVLTKESIDAMHKDAQALNLLPPDFEPRATEHIPTIIHLIERLIKAEVAYLSENGDVCFEVSRFPAYGKLSRKKIEDLLMGARIDVVHEKRSPLDFVLWKRAKPGEPSWDSPWGKGRPGWHIECSAMAMEVLGEQFDIHGGGLDLEFPHHENEIAQSEACTHKTFANYWVHIGMLQVNNEKMAKSVGNFFTIDSVLKNHHHEVVRYFLMSSHYRSPLNYSEENFNLAKKALMRLYQSLKGITREGDEVLHQGWVDQWVTAMSDDFNTPMALSVLFQLSHEVNKEKSKNLAHTLKYLGGLLGLLQESAEDFLRAGVDESFVQERISARQAARLARNFKLADEIRDALLQAGIELEDSASGTSWRVNIEGKRS